MTLALAMRDMLRNRRHSLATLAVLAIGAMSVLLFGGYKANIKYSMQTEYVASGGHIQSQHRSCYLYGSGDPTAYGIPGYRGLIDAIQRDDVLCGMVVLAMPAPQFNGVAGNYAAGVSRTVVGWAAVAAEYHRMRQRNDFDLTDLQMASALKGTPPAAAVVGEGVARVLRLCDALGISDCPPPERSLRALAADASTEALPSDIAELGLDEAPASKSAGQDHTNDPRRLDLLVSKQPAGRTQRGRTFAGGGREAGVCHWRDQQRQSLAVGRNRHQCVGRAPEAGSELHEGSLTGCNRWSYCLPASSRRAILRGRTVIRAWLSPRQ